jgi:hypothetical protein
MKVFSGDVRLPRSGVGREREWENISVILEGIGFSAAKYEEAIMKL